MNQDEIDNIPKAYKEFYQDSGNEEDYLAMSIDETPPVFPETVYYGSAYIPFQQWSGKIYSPEEAFNAGTVFQELNQPYVKGARK